MQNLISENCINIVFNEKNARDLAFFCAMHDKEYLKWKRLNSKKSKYKIANPMPFKYFDKYEKEIIICDLFLSYGDIKNINKRRLEHYKADAFLSGLSPVRIQIPKFIRKDYISMLNETNKEIRIWSGKRSADELCGLYYLCNELKNKENLYIPDLPIPKNNHFWSNDINYVISQMIEYNKKITFNKISDDDYAYYSNKWERFKCVNSDLRVYENGNIYLYKYEDLYEFVIKNVKSNNGDSKLYPNTICSIHDENRKLSEEQTKMIVYKMVKESYVEIVEDNILDFNKIKNFISKKI